MLLAAIAGLLIVLLTALPHPSDPDFPVAEGGSLPAGDGPGDPDGSGGPDEPGAPAISDRGTGGVGTHDGVGPGDGSGPGDGPGPEESRDAREGAEPNGGDGGSPGEAPGPGEVPGADPATDGLPGPADPRPADPGSDDAPAPRPRIALVIDDVGYNLYQLEPFLEVDIPMTMAVLPKLAYSAEAATKSIDAGKEVILHLPLEAIGGGNPGPGTIAVSDDDDRVLRTFEENLLSVPGAVGANNHMGSRATGDERVMNLILKRIREQGLFFLDSRTTADSVVASVAERLNVPYAERHVFLDNEQDADSIKKALELAAEIAASNGYAVVIGHVWTDALPGILASSAAALRDAGFEFVSLSDILSVRHAGIRN